MFPVFARAGEIPEYEVEVPTVESEVVPTHPKKPKAHQGEQPNSKAHASASEPGNSGTDESEGSKGNGAATGNGNGNGGSSNGGKSSSNGGEAGKPNSGGQGSISEQKELPSEAKGKNVAESSGGGSSPVLPILIAVVVLAAISIGVVLYRQKQSGKGPGGHEPGQGSDGRVSSPNAS